MSLNHHCVLDSRQDVAQKRIRASPNKVRNLFQLIDGNLEILELLPKKNSNSTKSSLSIQNMQPVELSNKNKKQQLESRESIVVQQMPTKTKIGYYFQTLKCSTNTITTDQILNKNRTNNNISFNNTNANKSKESLNNKQSFNKNIKFKKNDNNNKRNKYSLILRKYKKIKYLDKVCMFHIFLILAFLFNNLIRPTNALLTVASVDSSGLDGSSHSNYNSDIGIIGRGSSTNLSSTKENNNNNHNSNGGHYLDKLDNLERSVAAVLIKVAYGTTSTTKRSIPDNSYVPSLTTIATPPLTTLRYLEKSQHKQKVNLHHRNYELDLERDHALPTSAPNADILKSNSNPTYPNPNRHHNHDRDRHRHLLSSTPIPSMHTIPKKGQPTIPMYPGDMPSYSPPGRSFFTPPLPPEYQNPFADKPTLRGTNNEGTIVNTGLYINRRPIPPPSLMPGHERIPFRPPELNGQQNGGVIGNSPSTANMPVNTGASGGALSSTQSDTLSPSTSYNEDGQRKKTLNTPSQKINNKSGINYSGINSASNINNVPLTNGSDQVHTSGRVHFPSISRILSGSNGKKEDIPEVLLKQVTSRPSFHAPPSAPVLQTGGATDHEGVNRNPNINQSKNSRDDENDRINVSGVASTGINDNGELFDVSRNMGRDDTKNVGITQPDEPKTQPKIKMSTKSTESPATGLNSQIYSTQIIHNLANVNNEQSGLTTSTPGGGSSSPSSVPASKEASKITGKHGAATWAVAWNIHVYLSVILFTILAVYSCFKLIFYNKLTHLFNQSYFRCIHLILIVICISRIFYLCYDAYNIHSTFNIFVSEILLNLPATFLTISFSVLILFLLIKSLNHKNNRYSALIRPLTVVVGSSVHVGLCITLHYVESYTTSHSHLYYQQQTYRNGYRTQNSAGASGTSGLNINSVNGLSSPTLFNQHHQLTTPPPPPRVLSLICQIIYIFICLSLGLLYLYIYRILKRVLRSKSQNYIHGYQNLSYAIHITIATALLFVLLAALQIFGAISISTTRPLITTASEMDWLQWGYQFSLRLIEIAIITLMSWVAGLKTGGNSGVLQREKTADNHNVAGFFLPCTSSSSQEHFETDYPAVCNANTNLHTYTMRTGKPIYDDNFALNSLGSQNTASQNSAVDSGQIVNAAGQRIPANNDFQLQNDFVRTYDTGSMRSVVPQSQGALHGHHHHHQLDNVSGHNFDFMTDPQTDHYENPNFELRSNKIVDNCYSEPLNPPHSHPHSQNSGYDFANFERPSFGGGGVSHIVDRPNSRCDKTSGKQFKSNLDRSNYENPERRSSSSTHSCTNGRYPSYNSFEKRSGVRKSGTLNNIGGIVHGRNGSSSSSSSSSRPSGVQTLSTSHNRGGNNNSSARTIRAERDRDRDRREITNSSILGGGVNKAYYRGNGGGERAVISNHQSSLERSSSTVAQQFILPFDDDIVVGCNAERTNLINGSGSGITSSTSGGNLTDNGGVEIGCQPAATPSMSVSASSHILNEMPKNGGGVSIGGDNVNGGSGASASSGDSANSGSMLVAEHGFVRFRALDDINNAQGVGIHNASIRTTGRSKEKRYTNNT